MIDASCPYLPFDAAPRSVYVHIPFCRHRCGYCNFALVAGRDRLIDPFLDALEKEVLAVDGVHEIDTLFFGGGTPSHLTEQQLGRLGRIVSSRFVLADGAEVSAECNPSDISSEKLKSLSLLGLTRISLGVQSFNEQKLADLERDHDRESAIRAFDLAMDAVGNVSMDLIFATPEEGLSEWESDLETAIELNPCHLSTYELTWEKGTTFWNRKAKGELDGSSEDLRAAMYETAIERCNADGLSQYEVSSFALSGKRCRHNIQYWLCNPWFAFGPGAAAYVNGIRRTNHRSTTTWMKRIRDGESAVQETEVLNAKDRAIERLIFGLRMVDGINVTAFEDASKIALNELAGDVIASLEKRSLIERSATMLRLTSAGRMIADSVACELI